MSEIKDKELSMLRLKRDPICPNPCFPVAMQYYYKFKTKSVVLSSIYKLYRETMLQSYT